MVFLQRGYGDWMSDQQPKPDFSFLAKVLGSGTGVAPLLERYLVENRVYKNEVVSLDGYTFRNCAFIGCSLLISKGNFHIWDCHIANCMAQFGGNALNVVKLSALMLGTWDQFNEELRPSAEPDGGVTIG